MKGEQPKKILMLLADGHTASGIGDNLGLSKRTIERHMERLKDKHGAKNVHHLVSIAFRKKLIQ